MSTNDSTTRGFLTPVDEAKADDSLKDLFQQLVAGVTGIDGELVRPRWQPEPANTPDWGTDWAAIGVTNRNPDCFAAVMHDGAGEGTDRVVRHEELEVLCSFYGPAADDNAELLFQGLSLSQNRETLGEFSCALVEVGDPLTVPEMFKNRWLYRVDVPMTIRRAVSRVYQVKNLASAEAVVNELDVIVEQN